jgi:hypothetical protein
VKVDENIFNVLSKSSQEIIHPRSAVMATDPSESTAARGNQRTLGLGGWILTQFEAPTAWLKGTGVHAEREEFRAWQKVKIGGLVQ